MYRFCSTAVLVLGVTTIGFSAARGQDPSSGFGPPATEWGPFYHHASTVAQGFLDGRASVIRAYGLWAYNTALAQRHFQAARQQAMENSVLKADTYYRRKKVRMEYSADMRQRRPARLTPEQYRRMLTRQRPDRLRAFELDRMTGRIQWPDALRDKRFHEHRDQLEKLFARRTPANSGLGTKSQADIKRLVDKMRSLLTKVRRTGDLDVDAGITASRFLASLRYEAYFPAQNELLAAKVRP